MDGIGVEGRTRLREIEEKEKMEKALREAGDKSPFRDFAQVNRKLVPHIIRVCGE